MRTLCLAVLLCCAVLSAGAQGLHITQPPPNCNLLESRFDNPVSDSKGFYQPAILWHGEYAITSYALAVALDRVTGHRMPRWLSAGIVITGIGVAPHFRSVVLRRDYPLNPLDVTYDFVNRFTPAIWAVGGDSTKSFWQNHGKAFGIWLVSDLALSCFASP